LIKEFLKLSYIQYKYLVRLFESNQNLMENIINSDNYLKEELRMSALIEKGSII
jgi:hypothetical protein